MQKRIAHSVFLWSHRWFGLIAGLYFVAFGITGSYLVYESPIDALMYPDRFRSAAETNVIDLPAIVASAQAGMPTDKQPTRLTLPEGAKNAILQFNLAEAGSPPQNKIAYVDPSNGAFKGVYERLDSIGGLMAVFHHDLFLGAATGRLWMGISGIFLLFILLSGLWIWWPKTNLLKRSLKWPKFRSLYKASLDLHKLFGIYSLVLMFAVTFSGMYISVPGWFQFGEQKGGGPRGGGPGGPGMTSEIPTIDFAAVQKALESQGLLKRPLSIGYNGREKSIQVRGSEGTPAYVYDPSAQTLTAKVEEAKSFEMRRFQREVHGGQYWGVLGEVLTFISGLLPLFFFVTGFYVWWKKSRLQRARLN